MQMSYPVAATLPLSLGSVAAVTACIFATDPAVSAKISARPGTFMTAFAPMFGRDVSSSRFLHSRDVLSSGFLHHTRETQRPNACAHGLCVRHRRYPMHTMCVPTCSRSRRAGLVLQVTRGACCEHVRVPPIEHLNPGLSTRRAHTTHTHAHTTIDEAGRRRRRRRGERQGGVAGCCI